MLFFTFLLPLLSLSLVTSQDYETFSKYFGDEMLLDEIVNEMIMMGIRPQINGNQPQPQMNRNQTFEKPTSKKEMYIEMKNKKTSKDEGLKSVSKDESLDLVFPRSEGASHSILKRSADEMDAEDGTKGEDRQARLFYNFDRGSAFNTSVAFTIPLFSFLLPGAGDISADGVDGSVFGTMAFVSLFLLGGLGVAIYTTTQGAIDEARSLGSLGSDLLEIAPAVVSILSGLEEPFW